MLAGRSEEDSVFAESLFGQANWISGVGIPEHECLNTLRRASSKSHEKRVLWGYRDRRARRGGYQRTKNDSHPRIPDFDSVRGQAEKLTVVWVKLNGADADQSLVLCFGGRDASCMTGLDVPDLIPTPASENLIPGTKQCVPQSGIDGCW